MHNRLNWTDETKDQAGDIIQKGTPLSAKNMNNIEDGIQDSHLAFSVLTQYFMQFERWVRRKISEFSAEFINEIQTVTLTTTKGFPFNNSAKTVAMVKTRNTLNYDVAWEVTASNGNIGDITITDKQLNGFKVAYDGSAKSITLKLRIGNCETTLLK